MKKLKYGILTIGAILLVCACGKENPADGGDPPPSPPPQEDPMKVGTGGGSVSNADSTVTLNIPSGSLTSEVTFTIEETTSHPGNAVGTVYDIGPDGTQFDPAATLTLKYDEADLPSGAQETELVLATVENDAWTQLTTTINEQDNTVSAEISHLSIFGVIIPPSETAGWSTPQQISGSDVMPSVFNIYDEGNPEVAFDGNGNALAVWRQTNPEELWWSRYDAGADSWSAPSAIAGSAGARTLSLAMNDNGDAVAAWHSFNSSSKENELYASIYTPSIGWSTAERVDGFNGSQPDAAMDPNGQATVTWSSAKQDPDNTSVGRTKTVSVNQFTPGSGWGVPIVLKDYDFTETFSRVTVGAVETAPNGEAYVIWTGYDGVDTYYISFALISDTGYEGSGNIYSSTEFIAGFPELAIDGNGNAIIAWGQNTSGSYRELRAVEYDRSADLFGNPVVVDNTLTGTHKAFSLSSAGDGTGMLVWRGYDGVYNSVYASLFTPGSGWGSPEPVENIDMDEGTSWDGDEFRPKVTRLADGTFLTSWHFRGEQSDAASYVNSFTLSGGWGTPQLVQDYWVDGMVEYAAWPYPAAGPDGEALLIWAQGEDNKPSDVWISRFTTSN